MADPHRAAYVDSARDFPDACIYTGHARVRREATQTLRGVGEVRGDLYNAKLLDGKPTYIGWR